MTLKYSYCCSVTDKSFVTIVKALFTRLILLRNCPCRLWTLHLMLRVAVTVIDVDLMRVGEVICFKKAENYLQTVLYCSCVVLKAKVSVRQA